MRPEPRHGTCLSGSQRESDRTLVAVAIHRSADRVCTQVDIDAGELAIKKTKKNAEVKKFAERMVADHTAVNKAAVDLVTKLKVTPEDSDASRGLASGGAETRAKLEKLDGDAFDRAYMDNEVAYHKAVIGVLDSQRIPSASNAELKSTLVGVRPAFDAHLQHAMQFQPAALDVSVGDVVVWTNEDIVLHTVTAAGAFDSQTMTSKQEWRYTATKAGEYPYACTFLPTMKAMLSVR